MSLLGYREGTIGALLNFPLTYSTFWWINASIYFWSAFYHVIGVAQTSFFSIYFLIFTLSFLLDSVYVRLSDTSNVKDAIIDCTYSIVLPYLILRKFLVFYRKLKEENIYIRLSFWMIFTLVSFFSFIIVLVLLIFLFNSPFEGIVVLLKFMLVGPAIYISRIFSRLTVEVSIISVAIESNFRKGVILLFSFIAPVLIFILGP